MGSRGGGGDGSREAEMDSSLASGTGVGVSGPQCVHWLHMDVIRTRLERKEVRTSRHPRQGNTILTFHPSGSGPVSFKSIGDDSTLICDSRLCSHTPSCRFGSGRASKNRSLLVPVYPQALRPSRPLIGNHTHRDCFHEIPPPRLTRSEPSAARDFE